MYIQSEKIAYKLVIISFLLLLSKKLYKEKWDAFFQYNWHCVSVLNFFSCYFLFILLLSAWHSYILYNLRKVCATYQTTSRWEERDGVVLYWHKNGMKEITTQKERIYKKKKKPGHSPCRSFFFVVFLSFFFAIHNYS
jgi:hypothetical protein